MKSVRIAAVVGALALGALAVALFAVPAGAGAADESRTLTVNGTGSVVAVPDRAEWSFGVQTQAASASEALRRNAVAAQKVIAALRSAGLDAADLRTEQVSLYPQTDEDGRVVAYVASNTVHSVVRDLDEAGAVVDAAAEAGANQIYGPTLTRSDSEALYEQALAKAFEQARAKAEGLARSAGVTLGRVVSLTESGSAPAPLAAAAADKAEAGGVPIEPGTTEIQGFLTVTFAIS